MAIGFLKGGKKIHQKKDLKMLLLTLLLNVVRDESRLLIDDLLKEFRLLGGRE